MLRRVPLRSAKVVITHGVRARRTSARAVEASARMVPRLPLRRTNIRALRIVARRSRPVAVSPRGFIPLVVH